MAGLGLVLGAALLFTPLLPLGAAMIVGSLVGGGALMATAFAQSGAQASSSSSASNLAKPAADKLDAFYDEQEKHVIDRLKQMPKDSSLSSVKSSRSETPIASETSSEDEGLGLDDMSHTKLTSSPAEVSSNQKASISQSDLKEEIRHQRRELPGPTFDSFNPGTPDKKQSISEDEDRAKKTRF